MKTESLIIKKNGYIVKTSYNPNTKKFENQDITSNMCYYLQEQCHLDNDVVLKDIFLLLYKHINILKIIINNYIEDILKEAFQNQEEYSGKYDKNNIEYLQISKYVDWYDSSSLITCHVNGIGHILKENFDSYKIGDRINWALDFIPINKIINYPIKLNNKVLLVNFPDKYLVSMNNEYNGHMFTLFDILYWPIYEFSFYGNPKSRDKKFLEITEMHKNINKSG